MTRVWTPAEIDALGVRTDLVTACSVLGIGGRTKAYELYRRGELPFPVITAGHRIVCPTAPLRELLGLTPAQPDPSSVPADNSTPPASHHADPSGTNVRVMQQQRSRAP